jgi:hypothetical protein
MTKFPYRGHELGKEPQRPYATPKNYNNHFRPTGKQRILQVHQKQDAVVGRVPASAEGVARARMALSRPSTNLYSITSSVSASSLGGMSRPSTLAVLRLITSSNLVGCVTGKSAGLTPLRIRPA